MQTSLRTNSRQAGSSAAHPQPVKLFWNAKGGPGHLPGSYEHPLMRLSPIYPEPFKFTSPLHEENAGKNQQEREPGKLIMTADVVETLASRHGIMLTPEGSKNMRRMELQFLEGLKRHFNGEVKVVSGAELEEIYRGQLSKEKLPIISIDDLWFYNGVQYFHINRELDVLENKIRLKPRNGHLSLERQAQELRRVIPGSDVALLDRGTIKGGTIAHSVELLKKAGLNVRKVYIAIRAEQSMEQLRKKLGPSIEVVPLAEKLVCGEWLESRDLAGVSGRPLAGDGARPAEKRGRIPYFTSPDFISAPVVDLDGFRSACMNFLGEVEKMAGFVLKRV